MCKSPTWNGSSTGNKITLIHNMQNFLELAELLHTGAVLQMKKPESTTVSCQSHSSASNGMFSLHPYALRSLGIFPSKPASYVNAHPDSNLNFFFWKVGSSNSEAEALLLSVFLCQWRELVCAGAEHCVTPKHVSNFHYLIFNFCILRCCSIWRARRALQ